MRTGRPKKALTLKPPDKEKLELLARRPKTAQRTVLRAKIVLRAAEGLANQEIARKLGITGSTIRSPCHSFVLLARLERYTRSLRINQQDRHEDWRYQSGLQSP
jgi:DNA-binding NarL/FixJ family response regulator